MKINLELPLENIKEVMRDYEMTKAEAIKSMVEEYRHTDQVPPSVKIIVKVY